MLSYEGIIIENPNLRSDWQMRRPFPDGALQSIPYLPEGVKDGVSPEVYNAYRQGRDSACVDIVFVTRGENGTPMVVMSLRAPNACYGNKFWIYGGALGAYQSIGDFIAAKAEKECGVRAEPQALIGVYRTMAEDKIGSTTQPCYVAEVPIAAIREKGHVDGAHTSLTLMSEINLLYLNHHRDYRIHWYPLRVAILALRNMPR